MRFRVKCLQIKTEAFYTFNDTEFGDCIQKAIEISIKLPKYEFILEGVRYDHWERSFPLVKFKDGKRVWSDHKLLLQCME
jgi:hypothetical protein